MLNHYEREFFHYLFSSLVSRHDCQLCSLFPLSSASLYASPDLSPSLCSFSYPFLHSCCAPFSYPEFYYRDCVCACFRLHFYAGPHFYVYLDSHCEWNSLRVYPSSGYCFYASPSFCHEKDYDFVSSPLFLHSCVY